ncbi:DUF1289 domain-containing protein [Sphingomonas cannabina]|uniref:DUF1289 domain-containing protein n=1 Tax=Sphingomonas cannabina TaxID=2899123 RepID=UPI001F408CBB|nr:DUF1289 domain-containing protein [Sphingomonas cannabina]UIJ45019.1 DUF1289 domain-containing protein [Sphingomonas cannabina]
MDDDLFEYSEPARVQSPCINVCVLDPATGWCLGCGRSGDEVEEWSSITDARRQAILDRLPARLEALRNGSRPTRSP